MTSVAISVIIPFSRPEVWSRLIEQIKSLKYSRSALEIIVVINNVGTWEPPQIPQEVKVIWESRHGPSYARNTGIKAAQFSHQVFLDDDCIFDTQLLKQYETAWNRYPEAVIIGGKVIAQLEDQKKSLNTKQRKELLHKFGWCFGQLDYGDKDRSIDVGSPLFSANLGINQPVGSLHLFSEALGKVAFGQLFLGEDCLLNYSVLCVGKSVMYVPKITVYNRVSHQRFTSQYVKKRVLLAGAERCVTDLLLINKSNWQTYYQSWFRAIRHSFKGKQHALRTLLHQPYLWLFLLGYFGLGPVLIFNNIFEKLLSFGIHSSISKSTD